MKIISKFTDYYDYLTHVYGIDELLVYDRTKLKFCERDKSKPIEKPYKSNTPSEIDIVEVYINNKKYFGYTHEGNIYYGSMELRKLIQTGVKLNYRASHQTHLALKLCGLLPKYGFLSNGGKKWWENLDKIQGIATTVNQEERQPVLTKSPFNDSDEYAIPVLGTYDFCKVLDARSLFLEVSEFLGWMNDHPELPDNQTDKEKVSSHGFDLKKSFRHRK